ncbi:MAG: DsbA family protein [Kofleriaceae bacterium]
MVLLAVLLLACGKEHRPSADNQANATGGRASATLDALATELAAITGDPPAPTVTLRAGVAITPENTLVIAHDDLAFLRKEAVGAAAVRTPEREVLADLLVEARGGVLQNRIVVTDASRATALASIDKITHVVVVTERVWLKELSRQTLAVWDRAAKRWIGTLWITLPLTTQPDKEMAMFSNGKQVGGAFTVSEKPEERAARHRYEIRGVANKAITERSQQWIARGRYEMLGPPFAATEKRYTVPVGVDSPTWGGADAHVVVQLFAQHGDADVALLVARIVQVYGDRVRVVWRDYPLAFLKDSGPAAHAAREVLAAGGPDAFWRYLEGLATRKATAVLTTDDLVGEAERLGTDGARVRTAIETRAHRAAIDADVSAFRAAKLPTKPSIASFTNGWTLSTTSFAAHATRIDAALKDPR